MSITAFKLTVHGRVQGVFYRKTAAEQAQNLGLTGWVKNNPDGTVEMVIQGEEKDLSKMIEWCWEGPKNAVVTKVEQVEISPENYSDFRVVR